MSIEPELAPESPADGIAALPEYPVLFLRRGEDDRLRQGHLWVYSNEVDSARSPLSAFAPGEIAAISDAGGRVIGLGYVNPQALICARLLERGARHPIGRSLIVHRLQVALALRERLYPEPFYRLVFGEADGLPGLVLDRFDDVIVGQIGTLGMEQLKADVVEAVVKVLKPRTMVWKNRGSVRALEGLPEYFETAVGTLDARSRVVEAGVEFRIDIENGQKTGWFFDQRDNRAWLKRLVPGRRVLDVFSYAGAWGVASAVQGAREVHCIDSSAAALAVVTDAAERNGVAERVHTQQADAFEA
ncbi:MAG: class I SAM-dependent rRNA methyltransferase, partial [Lysobacterales bacterium]